MGKATTYRSILIQEPNKWHANNDTWQYGNYRYCYLTIRKLDNNKYKPALGAFNDIPYPGHDLPSCGYFEYDTLEEAQKHLFEYVDWIRDVYDIEAKKALQRRLHDCNPMIYPA